MSCHGRRRRRIIIKVTMAIRTVITICLPSGAAVHSPLIVPACMMEATCVTCAMIVAVMIRAVAIATCATTTVRGASPVAVACEAGQWGSGVSI